MKLKLDGTVAPLIASNFLPPILPPCSFTNSRLRKRAYARERTFSIISIVRTHYETPCQRVDFHSINRTDNFPIRFHLRIIKPLGLL